MYIVSQILVFISTAILGATYFFKDKLKILILCLFYCIIYGIHYFLLGALTGTMMNLVSLTRNYYFYRNGKKNRKNSKLILFILMLISIFFCIVTYNNIFSIVSLVASLLSTYSVWQDNTKIYKILAIPVSICFIIYAISINSVAALITESLLLVVEILAIVKLYVESKNILKQLT